MNNPDETWQLGESRTDEGTNLIECLYCDESFPTLGAEERHVERMHLEESQFHCPVCKKNGFRMPSDLMGHIERGKCNLTLRQLNRRRQRQDAFRRQLDLQGPGPDRQNFQRFMDKRAPSVTQTALSMISDIPRGVSTVSASDSQALVALSRSPNPSIRDVRSDGSVNSNMWQSLSLAGRSDSLFLPDFQAIDVFDDLSDGTFDSELYLDEYSGKYHCPIGRCPKIFKNGGALQGHLRSSAHSNVRYTCPQCHSRLNTLEGMTAHAQDVRSKCGISRKEMFGPYMEQLTAGLVDVIFIGPKKRVKYETSQAAEAEFSNTALTENDQN